MNNCFVVTKQILRLLNIKFTSQYLKDCILSHPDYNSLLSIADTLEEYSIKCLPVNINWSKLIKAPLPCLVQVEVKGISKFFIIKYISGINLTYYDDQNNLVKTTKEKFLEIWTGVCLLIEPNEKSSEVRIDEKLKLRRVINLLKAIVFLSIAGWMVENLLNSDIIEDWTLTINVIFYTAIKILGLITASFLLWLEIDQFNPSLQKFCTGNHRKINCNSVLSSKYSKLFNGTISLSILGFSYFFATGFYLVSNNYSPQSLSILSILSFVNIPVVIISVYYQGIILKEWCKFCILIQVILTGEIIISYFAHFNKNVPPKIDLFQLLLLMITPILIWKLLKPFFKRSKEINSLKRNFKKIKYNKNIFEFFLIKSKRIKTPTNGLGIYLKNASATIDIVKVCNPYCPPCSRAHAPMKKLLNSGKINLQILFTVPDHPEDVKNIVVNHFLEIDSKENKTETKKALDFWYNANEKDYDMFKRNFPRSDRWDKHSEKIKQMIIWCQQENITHTPTIFINGYELPTEYSVDDLVEVLK